MSSLLAFAAILQQSSPSVTSAPTGLEWMTVASVVVPAVLLLVIVWLGQRSRV